MSESWLAEANKNLKLLGESRVKRSAPLFKTRSLGVTSGKADLEPVLRAKGLLY